MKEENKTEEQQLIEKLQEENKMLKNRCRTLSSGTLCLFCPMQCDARGLAFRGKEVK